MRRRIQLGAVVTAGALAAGAGVVVVDVPAARADVRSVVLVAPGTDAPGSPTYDGAAGRSIFFSASEPLTSDDHDDQTDVYRRTGDLIELMTPGTAQNVVFDGVSQDGDTVIVTTREALTAADTDSWTDIYRVTKGTWSPLTPMGADIVDADFDAASTNGRTIVYNAPQLYVSNGTARAVAPNAQDAIYDGASTTLDRVFFHTGSSLVPADTGPGSDVYVDAGGQVSLVSDGVGESDKFEGASNDGRRAYITSYDAHPELGDDAKATSPDVFTRTGSGPLELVSRGAETATYGGISADGSIAYFGTQSPLAAGDDNLIDVYRRDATGTVTLMTGGGTWGGDLYARSVSADGSTLVYETTRNYAGVGDSDYANDVYRVRWPAVADKQLLSGDNSTKWVHYEATAGDRVFFNTLDPLTTTDSDDWSDIYVSENGVVDQVSDGDGPINAQFAGASTDGALAWIRTLEQVVPQDNDDRDDLYASSSTGPGSPTPTTAPPTTAPPTTAPPTTAPPTTAPPTTAPPTTAPPTTAATLDTTPPTASIGGRSPQRPGRTIRFAITCGTLEDCSVSGTWTLKVTRPAGKGALRFTSVLPARTVSVATRAVVVLPLTGAVRPSTRTAIRRGDSAVARVHLRVTDAAGNDLQLSLRIALA